MAKEAPNFWSLWLSVRSTVMILFFFSIGCLFFLPADAQEESSQPLHIRKFTAEVQQISDTQRVYLFHTIDPLLPKPGSMLLAKEGDTKEKSKSVMAFRVLRNDPHRGEFLAKRIKRYDVDVLQLNHDYTLLEKNNSAGTTVSALETPAASPAIASPATATSPIASEAPTTSPTPEPMDVNQAETESIHEESNPTPPEHDTPLIDDEFTDYEIEEIQPLDPYRMSLSLMGAYYRNLSSFQITGTVQSTLLLFLGFKPFRNLFFLSKNTQDWIDLEFGFGRYTYLNVVADPIRDYSIVPLLAQARYNVQASEILSFNIYGGMGYNLITSAQNLTRLDHARFGNAQQLMGIGLAYTIGPQWRFRVDLGWDRIAAGLMLKW